MPRITLSTQVKADVATVAKGFDHALFMRLAPPFPLVRLLRFDGCRTGDKVEIQLNFLLFKQDWHSLITQHQHTAEQFDFVDEGVQLPWPLKKWRHYHIINQNTSGHVCITDDIIYSTSGILVDWLVYPFLWLQFAYRKPIYHKVFGR